MLTNRPEEHWYEAKDTVGEYAIGVRLWSLGEALERAVRHLNRPIHKPNPITISECWGTQSGYSSQPLLICESKDGDVLIRRPKKDGA